MECPKCGATIKDDALVCQNCKKVLKLVCPICHAINTKNTCHQCGYIILNKCHNCGKINQTIVGNCPKCGFDTNVSAILQVSNCEEFASLTLDFPNLEDMKTVLGSQQLYDKFKEKLNNLIFDYAKSIGLKRGVFGHTYLIRFNKDYTFAASAKNAMKSTIELLTLITTLNSKLTKEKDIQLRCNAAILKRDVYAPTDDYKSGVNINMLYEDIHQNKLLKKLQLIVDGSIYEIVGKTYNMSSIGMTIAKNQRTFLYETNLEHYIDVEKEEKTEENIEDIQIDIPNIIDAVNEQLEEEDSIYDIEGISFNEIQCKFTKDISQGLSNKVTESLARNKKQILVIKGKKEYQIRTAELVDKIKSANIYSTIHQMVCYEAMQFKPYGFFNDFITKNMTQNAGFTTIAQIDKEGYIADLINLKEREMPHPDEVRAGTIQLIKQALHQLDNSLIIIENAEKMDDTSNEILKQLLNSYEEYNISFVILADKDYSLHKNSHSILSKKEYTEITLKPTPIKELINANASLCKNILDTFYMQKISKNTKGSQMYFMQAMVHLMDLGIFKVEKGTIKLDKTESVVFPTTLDELICQRIRFIKSIDQNLFLLFAGTLILGPQINLQNFVNFGIQGINDYLSYLEMKGFISIEKNVITVQSYNLYYQNIQKVLTLQEKTEISKLIINNIYKQNSINPTLAQLYEIVNDTKNEFVQWENLSNINRSLGDFSAYFNCSTRLLKMLSNNINESTDKSIEEYKMEVYENITNLLYKYTPEKISNITQVIINNFETGTNNKKIVNLCNKIMQGCIISGNYSFALNMSNTVLSNLENSSTNPKSTDFSQQALLTSLIRLEILFNVGQMEDCITLGDDIFSHLLGVPLESICPKSYTINQFKNLIVDSIGYVIFAKTLQLKNDTYKFCEIAEKITTLPEGYKLFVDLNNLLHGKNLSNIYRPDDSDKFGSTLYYILYAFANCQNNPDVFAEEIYHAKIKAKEHKLIQLELFCDLMIGKAYSDRNQIKKASSIINSVLETSQEYGLKFLFNIAAYATASIALKTNEINNAHGILSNSIIQIEKDQNLNLYTLMLYKLLYAKTLQVKKEDNQANFCYNQAVEIAKTHNIKLNNI